MFAAINDEEDEDIWRWQLAVTGTLDGEYDIIGGHRAQGLDNIVDA
jgi:hypothetical protein